jgi:hypothetical protein
MMHEALAPLCSVATESYLHMHTGKAPSGSISGRPQLSVLFLSAVVQWSKRTRRRELVMVRIQAEGRLA